MERDHSRFEAAPRQRGILRGASLALVMSFAAILAQACALTDDASPGGQEAGVQGEAGEKKAGQSDPGQSDPGQSDPGQSDPGQSNLAELSSGGISSDGAIYENTSAALAARPGGFEAYIFYLHGRIIEEAGRRPTHPEYGVYEYDRILEALAIPGAAVISEAREARTNPAEYADRVISEIRQLFDAGVDPSAITVVGFSKGGVIALMTSHRLGHDGVGFVVLAACGSWLDAGVEGEPLRLYGRMLSIHEQSDPIGPCRPYVEASLPSLFFHEVEISIGGSHGAFYEPRQDWLDQTLVWTGAPSIRSQIGEPERIDVTIEP